ncbi:MAG TPA: ABC transporter substrate-binding protein, partial [Myxococcaceae bacterium]|nr:ABC transporter substrate-binding protein [Myxococcaceae bacterium]
MRRLGWLVAVAALAGCPSEKKEAVDAGPPGPKQLTEKEPNDRPEQAQPITESSIVSANLTADPSKPDEDWYSLESAAPKTVDLTVSGIPGGDVMLEIYDQDKNRLVSVNSEGEGKPERIPNVGLKGKLYVKVTA